MEKASIFRTEDSVALPIAVVLHIGVVALLVLQPMRDEILPISERMTVSLASEVSLEATAPNPAVESRAAMAPTLSDEAAPDVGSATEKENRETSVRPPATRRSSTAPASPERDRSRPDRTPTRTQSPPRADTQGGGSRIGEDFLPGQGSSTTTDNTSAPAANFGSAERAALSSAITRQLRPHWNAPSGVESEKLVSIVTWRLNSDGSLNGRPTCATNPGSITQSNRPQAGLHCERAIRAVQLAAPFNLPEQFYSRWKTLEWQFDRRL